MIYRSLVFALVAMMYVGFGADVARAAKGPIKTVDRVDVDRYMGQWYEIGSIPQWFQKGCVCTTAKYDLLENGKVRVTNTCRRGAPTEPTDVANGKAYVADEATNAKLKVTFFWPFYGDYWIIGLDPEYRWAVVSDSVGSSLWILARTPTLDETLLAQAVEAASQADIARLRWTRQTGCW